MPEMPRGRGIRRGRGRCQIGQQAGWVVSGIAVSSSPRRLWLQCLTLCRIRLRPQGPARRQKTRLRFEQREVLRKNQTRVGSPPGEREWNPAEEAAEGARAETQSPGGGPVGRQAGGRHWLLGSRLRGARGLGECGHVGTAGPSTALQAECCPHDPAPASDAGEEGAECSVLRGRARDAGPAPPLSQLCAAAHGHSEGHACCVWLPVAHCGAVMFRVGKCWSFVHHSAVGYWGCSSLGLFERGGYGRSCPSLW